jgi:alkylation response protein AidB-like acyl-CoA dehydrogenase
MDLRFTPEETAFREEVREFFRTALPARIRDKLVMGHHASKDELVEWTRILNAKGWAVPHWPVEWGGTGWDPVRQYIFQDEMQQAPAPSPLPFGVSMVGPVIIAFGSEAQKRRFLPRIANLDDWWCQGFSEPGSGSDLASLKTTAKRDGDAYVVTGQKTWTTLGQYADWIFVLARTDMAVKKQEGISFLLIDMKTPGITVRPIRTIDGGEEVNEVFLDEVRVPAENVIVREGGFGRLFTAFSIERLGNATMSLAVCQAAVDKVAAYVQDRKQFGRPLIDFQLVQATFADMVMQTEATRLLIRRAAEGAGTGTPVPLEASIAKCFANEAAKLVSDRAVQLLGGYGYSEEYDVERLHRDAHGWAIAGGTPNMQRMRIASEYLGRRFDQRLWKPA